MDKWSEDLTKKLLVVKLVRSAKLWYMDNTVEFDILEEWEREFELAFVPRQKKGALLEEILRWTRTGRKCGVIR